MRYSVYDYTRRAYDYYDAPGPGGTHAGSPPMGATPTSSVGSAPDKAAWRLPAGARKVGTGDMPQGRIASPSGAAGFAGLGDIADPAHLALYLAVGYVAWRMIR